MTDDRSKNGGQDRKLISLEQDYEVRDWAGKFGVSEERLRLAVGRVGNEADAVKRFLMGG